MFVKTRIMNIEVHAAPSTALRTRDWKALLELFDREDVDEIDADVHGSLRLLPPEPCWEDDPFDFLREYL
ncbi:hypothetical protein [Calothrix sp. PCC 7507]|uniref:hypothetical protein n=1 Tax=Calothrix sp. PCC 7507 TaxID=99598 RepID=UPI00029F3F45|nr:hypothetical protein [Calothrix sp. PCC 7507]AFY31215.1 hypothetical protein Cal7507_0727 [Calothrix sp. PCC 7507]